MSDENFPGLPGLVDDVDLFIDRIDISADGDAIVRFTYSTVVVFKGVGDDPIDSIADLVDDPSSQILGREDDVLLV